MQNYNLSWKTFLHGSIPECFSVSAALDRCSLAYNVCSLFQHPACSGRHFPLRCSHSHLCAASAGPTRRFLLCSEVKTKPSLCLPLIHGYSILYISLLGASLTPSRGTTERQKSKKNASVYSLQPAGFMRRIYPGLLSCIGIFMAVILFCRQLYACSIDCGCQRVNRAPDVMRCDVCRRLLAVGLGCHWKPQP